PALVARNERQRADERGAGADRRRGLLLVDRTRQAMAGPAQRGAVLRGRGAGRQGVRARSVGAHPARRRPRSAGLGIVRGGVPPLRQGRASQAGGCGCTDRRTRPTATLGGVPPMTVSRRNFLALSALGVAAVALPSCGRSEGIEQTAELLTSEGPLPKPFTVPLPVPA